MTDVLDDFSDAELTQIERATLDIGPRLLARSQGQQPWVLERRWWDDRVMAWTMHDEALKVQLFRFVDVLPMLDTSEAVTRHLQEYLHDADEALPGPLKLGLALATPGSIAGRAVAMAARKNAQGYARRFIAGSKTTEVLAAAMRERKLRRSFTLDVLGEAVTSELEADRYLQTYLELLETVSPVVNAWPEMPDLDRDVGGRITPRMNVSVKLSALDSQFDPIDPDGTRERVARRLRELLRAAARQRAYVHVDMESYHVKDLTLRIFQSVLMEPEFRETSDVGIVIQCYLRDAERDIRDLYEWARKRGRPVWVRLVKGAYWDYETVRARAAGWPVPVFQQKWQSDATFERVSRFVLRHADVLRPALGSHNVRSLAHGIATAQHLRLPVEAYELQMLYGMADAEKQALVELGQRLRVYMPYGELIPGMAYLVRRLLENTSNDSFLKASVTDKIAPETLLMNPLKHGAAPEPVVPPGGPPVDIHAPPVVATFRNQPHADFAVEENRAAMAEAVEQVRQQLGLHHPLEIGGESVDTQERITSLNPSHKSQVVGTTASATLDDVESAVAAARKALPSWRATSVDERASYLERAADELQRRKWELAAWEVHECGKTWREADADVAEAIDFCRYYALSARAILARPEVDVPGEANHFIYRSRGVAAIIAPWNFPLAILTGMTTAALVSGNTVVMKPAEQSPIIAAKLMEVFHDLELPPGVLNFLPGAGETVGAALVEHPDVALITFTGSRAVGLEINRRAAEVSAAGVPMVKRLIAEMGGKNAIIVDDDADLDEAVLGVVRSAFGYQGQKCSACSRAIVLARVYDAFLERLIGAASSLQIGPAEDPATSVGPVIDAEAFKRVKSYIDIGRKEAREALAVEAGPLAEEGFYIGPHVFADVAPSSRLAQEEIFGPVLAVIKAQDLDEAIDIANSTDYALTCGVFSRSPANLDRCAEELQCGNLYLNRGITGAMVGRQPFGGFKMSGIGSQAGGPDYLLQFVIPRTITENTMRRGFAPSESADVGYDPAGE